MPRKTAKRVVHFGFKRFYSGAFGRNFTAKVIAARKFHTNNQGLLLYQKSGGSQDCTRVSLTPTPLLSRQPRLFTFASLPLQSQAPASYRVDVQRKTSFAAPPPAPSFAVNPLWQSGGLRKCQKPLQTASKPARAASKTRYSHVEVQKEAPQQQKGGQGWERGAMQWYAALGTACKSRGVQKLKRQPCSSRA